MRIAPTRWSLVLALGVGAAASPFGCSAGVDDQPGGNAGSGAENGSTSSADGGATNSTGNMGGGFVTSGGGDGGQGGMIVDPCNSECGPLEICDGGGKGIDNDCDGTVDEDCPCGPGEASSCFKGEPSYLDPMYPSCAPGTMSCTENGTWGPCTGGHHATDLCFQDSAVGCHPIHAVPFATVDLYDGTGTFDDNADTDSFDVACPMGVNPCPAVNANLFQPLQSGEYTVTYTKTVGAMMEQCSFPLFVGARGLRVELEWNWGLGGARDLDFHLHQPATMTAWSVSGTGQQDCGYGNCTIDDIEFGFNPVPDWFPATAPFGDPVKWYLDPDPNLNSCYFAPRGVGMQWQQYGQGCHNPRLDLDNISCSLSSTDPDDFDFCAPENINVDFPPADEWFRVGVFMYSSSPPAGITPNVKIYCDGALRAELGSKGFNNPEAPIVWDATQGRKWWLAADVIFKEDECNSQCIVRPLYLNDDDTQKLPLYYTEAQLNSQFGPPYAPIPP